MFDLNRDGKLSRNEIRSGAAKMGQPVTEAELDAAFKMMDTNRDGLISKAEFIKFVETY